MYKHAHKVYGDFRLIFGYKWEWTLIKVGKVHKGYDFITKNVINVDFMFVYCENYLTNSLQLTVLLTL